MLRVSTNPLYLTVHTISSCYGVQQGDPLGPWPWLRASLPTSLGGLGLRRASFHAPAVYISSFQEAGPLISHILGHNPVTPPSFLPSVYALPCVAANPDWCLLEDINIPLRQHCLSHAIDKAQYAALLDLSPDPRSRALALSSTITHAGDWLSVVLSLALGLHLIDREFRLCLLYWLVLPMSEEGHRCSICNSEADTFGDHQVGCGGNGDRIHRRDSLCDAIFSAAQSAALVPRKEVPSLIPNTQCRPADIYLPNWKRGLPVALDVTVISTLQSLTVNQASFCARPCPNGG